MKRQLFLQTLVKSNRGLSNKGKTYEEIYGPERALKEKAKRRSGGKENRIEKRGKFKRTDEWKRKVSEHHKRKGIKPPSRKGHKASEKTKEKQRNSWTLEKRKKARTRQLKYVGKESSSFKHYQLILEQAEKLKRQGFIVIPLTKVIPDIIALKGNKIIAVEVHNTGRPNYSKYTKDIKQFYDKVMWIKVKRKEYDKN